RRRRVKSSRSNSTTSRSGRGDGQRTQYPYVEVVGVDEYSGLANGRPAFEHGLQGDATFEPGQRRSEAVMDSMSGRDVLSVWAVENEAIGLWERFGVSICGGKYQQQRVARPDGLITEDDVFKRR